MGVEVKRPAGETRAASNFQSLARYIHNSGYTSSMSPSLLGAFHSWHSRFSS
jgi:hypothetical protein